MVKLDLLRSIAASGVIPEAHNQNGLSSDTLRFVLQYRSPPVIVDEFARISALLRTQQFTLNRLFLKSEEAELACFLVLSIPGVERALPVEDLFSMSYALVEELQLVSVEPDIGSPFFADPEPPGKFPHAEGVDLLRGICWVETSNPPAEHWALENANVFKGWALSGNKGGGILVGQPDTGIAKHDELEQESLRLDLAANILDGSNDPTDPLEPHMANPGHGTGTASVVVSSEAGRIIGAAPQAKLVPIRCISDVKIFDAAPVAAAVDHARHTGCHVITMSLGGVPSHALHAAIEKAIDAGMIVLAAAGNCVGFVVWPARYDSVIAVAGCNSADQPWKGSSFGLDVDITAPAEMVWRASRHSQEDPVNLVAPGQGTSFATALVAGIAALWLAQHGLDNVITEARRRGISVQRLFRSALQQTARHPAEWNTDNFGPGIVDAAALLSLSLSGIVRAAPEALARRAADDARKLVAEISGPRSTEGASDFNWNKYGLEIAHALLNDARLAPRAAIHLPEAAHRTSVSNDLSQAIRNTTDPRLQDLLSHRRDHARAPHALRTQDIGVLNSISIVKRKRRTALEGTSSNGGLTPNVIRDRMDAFEKVLQYASQNDGNPEAESLRRDMLERGGQVLHRLSMGDPRLPIIGRDRAALEALIMLHDRPALRVTDTWLDMTAPELGDWKDLLDQGRKAIEPILPSIGRIDEDDGHIGTGFVVADGIVMTNRHVAEAFAMPLPGRENPQKWQMLSDKVTIDFSANVDGSMRFKIKSVIFTGSNAILDTVQFGHLDMALVEVETSNGDQKRLPPALSFDSRPASIRRTEKLFVVGYPAMPQVPLSDFDGVKRMEVVDQLGKIFNLRYGVKYFSPGTVHIASGIEGQDERKWAFGHDATTLGGNSGSCISRFGDDMNVVGLHFAGDWMRSNYAHSVSAVRQAGDMKAPAFAGIHWI